MHLVVIVEILPSSSRVELNFLILLLALVHLSGPDFEGFFIQARDAERLDSPAVGSFVLADRRHSQLLTCGRTKVESSALQLFSGH